MPPLQNDQKKLIRAQFYYSESQLDRLYRLSKQLAVLRGDIKVRKRNGKEKERTNMYYAGKVIREITEIGLEELEREVERMMRELTMVEKTAETATEIGQ